MDADELKLLTAKADAADALGAEAMGTAQPEQGAEAAPGAQAGEVLESAQADAEAVTELLAEGVEALVPALGFSPETRAKFSKRLGPVLAKHNLSMGFGKWKEEMELGMFTVGLIIGGIRAVRNSKPVDGSEIPTDTVKPDAGAGDGGK